jgi:hypothetical protein
MAWRFGLPFPLPVVCLTFSNRERRLVTTLGAGGKVTIAPMVHLESKQ